MRIGWGKGIARLQDMLGRRPRGSDPVAGAALERRPAVHVRPSGSGETSPEGWHLSPLTPLRIANPDFPPAGTRPEFDIHKPLPNPPTPSETSRSGSPVDDIDLRSVVFTESDGSGGGGPRVLRVMNPDPPSPIEAPLEHPAPATPYVPNFSRPFGPANPFPERPLAPGTAPYRPGLDPHSPLYRGEPVPGVPLRPIAIRPARQGRPNPPLRIIIPAGQGLTAPMPLNVVDRSRLRFGPNDRDPIPRPANPSPDHPLNGLPRRPEPARQRAGRPRAHSLISPTALETIREVSESPRPASRKPFPRDPAPAPAAEALARKPKSLPRALRWLDFRTWGARRAP